MLNAYAQTFLTACRFTPHTRLDPATEQRLEKSRRNPSIGPRTGFRPAFRV
jgi:hypothetical protein